MRLSSGVKKQAAIVAGSSSFGALFAGGDMEWWVRVLVVSVLSAVAAVVEKLLENITK